MPSVRFRLLALSLAFAGLAPVVRAQSSPSQAPSLDSLLNTRVTTAAKDAQTIMEAAASVTIITAAEIERFGWRDLDQVFAAVRGLHTSNDLNYPYLGVRGFSRPTDYNNRVLMLIDGHTFNENMYQSSPAGTDLAIDLASVERIEIVRGPGSALYGTSAMLAVVNIVTKSAGANPGLRASVSGGTDGERRVSARWGGQVAGTDIALTGLLGEATGRDLYFPEYDATATNRGVTHGTDYEYRHSMGLQLARGGLTLQGFTNWRDKGIPTGAFGTRFNDPRTHTIDINQFLEARYSSPTGSSTQLSARAYLDWYSYTGTYAYAPVVTTQPTQTGGTGDAELDQEHVHADAAGGEITVRRDLASNNRLVAGAEVRNVPTASYRSSTDGVETYRRDAGFTISSAYVQDEFQVTPTLALIGGVRHDRYSTGPSATTPRAALVWVAAPSTTAKLMYGEAFRAPSISESDLFQVGYASNPALRPEHLRTIELSLHQRLSPSTLATVALYDFRMTDLIDVVERPGDGLFQSVNQGANVVRGVEAELSTRVGDYLTYANATWQSARDANMSVPLKNSPSWMLKAGVSRRVSSVTWSVAGRYEDGRETVRGAKTDATALLDLHAGWAPATVIGGFRTRLDLVVRNALGTDFQVPAGLEHEQRSLPMERRTVSLQLSITP